MPEHPRAVYLHGFASSPNSRKASFLKSRFAQAGIRLETPDMAAGDFEHITITGQLRLLANLLGGGPAVLIGSSLGGYVAALYAARHPETLPVALLAPAFDFVRLWVDSMRPDQLAGWKSTGQLEIFHYGEGRHLPLSYSFLEDAGLFEPFPNITQPALIVHGVSDTVVPLGRSLEFVRQHPGVQMVELPSGHELTDVLDRVWEEVARFFGPIFNLPAPEGKSEPVS